MAGNSNGQISLENQIIANVRFNPEMNEEAIDDLDLIDLIDRILDVFEENQLLSEAAEEAIKIELSINDFVKELLESYKEYALGLNSSIQLDRVINSAKIYALEIAKKLRSNGMREVNSNRVYYHMKLLFHEINPKN